MAGDDLQRHLSRASTVGLEHGCGGDLPPVALFVPLGRSGRPFGGWSAMVEPLCRDGSVARRM
jgi:hypothetical protein